MIHFGSPMLREDKKLVETIDEPVTALGKVKAALRPSHYQHASGIEVIKLLRYESFVRGNILKYIFRAPHAGKELQDLLKSVTYLNMEVERLSDGKVHVIVEEEVA